MNIGTQIIWLFILALPVACISWTVTHEEIFSESRQYCKNLSLTSKRIIIRKFFYLFTCEYCFSFYVTALFLLITHFKLLYEDWRGYLIGGLSLVWISNMYMNFFFLIRIDIKETGTKAKLDEKDLKK